MLPGLDKHVATLAYHIRHNNVEQFLQYYDTELNNLTQAQVFLVFLCFSTLFCKTFVFPRKRKDAGFSILRS